MHGLPYRVQTLKKFHPKTGEVGIARCMGHCNFVVVYIVPALQNIFQPNRGLITDARNIHMPVAVMTTMMSVTLLAAILLATATGFLLPAHRSVPSRRLVRGSNQLLFATEIENSKESHIIIVGKIIMYKYGDPKSMDVAQRYLTSRNVM